MGGGCLQFDHEHIQEQAVESCSQPHPPGNLFPFPLKSEKAPTRFVRREKKSPALISFCSISEQQLMDYLHAYAYFFFEYLDMFTGVIGI